MGAAASAPAADKAATAGERDAEEILRVIEVILAFAWVVAQVLVLEGLCLLCEMHVARAYLPRSAESGDARGARG